MVYQETMNTLFHSFRALLGLSIAGAFCSCGNAPDVEKAAAPQERRIQMGTEMMLTIGDDWIFSYTDGGQPRAIVGDNVSLIDRKESHLAVAVDQHLEINVPTSGRHPVLIVDLNGISAVPVEFKDLKDDKEILQAVLEWNARRVEKEDAAKQE